MHQYQIYFAGVEMDSMLPWHSLGMVLTSVGRLFILPEKLRWMVLAPEQVAYGAIWRRVEHTVKSSNTVARSYLRRTIFTQFSRPPKGLLTGYEEFLVSPQMERI